MCKKKMLFVYNPHSGRGLIERNLPEIIKMYSASEYELVVHATDSQGDAFHFVGEYANENACDLVVSAGGDGTLDEVAAAVMESGNPIPVGIISAGSTNDFAYSLGIPSDICSAAEAVLESRIFPCDIANFNGRYFTYTAAFGTLADVSYGTPQNLKNALGHAAYILNGMMKLPSLKSYHLKAYYDDRVIEGDFIIGMVVSSKSVGGFKGITGDGVELDDGYHELILVKAGNIVDLTASVNELLSHKLENAKTLVYAKVKEVRFEFDDEAAWSLDGEFGGTFKDVDIKVIERGINYLVKEQ